MSGARAIAQSKLVNPPMDTTTFHSDDDSRLGGDLGHAGSWMIIAWNVKADVAEWTGDLWDSRLQVSGGNGLPPDNQQNGNDGGGNGGGGGNGSGGGGNGDNASHEIPQKQRRGDEDRHVPPNLGGTDDDVPPQGVQNREKPKSNSCARLHEMIGRKRLAHVGVKAQTRDQLRPSGTGNRTTTSSRGNGFHRGASSGRPVPPTYLRKHGAAPTARGAGFAASASSTQGPGTATKLGSTFMQSGTPQAASKLASAAGAKIGTTAAAAVTATPMGAAMAAASLIGGAAKAAGLSLSPLNR